MQNCGFLTYTGDMGYVVLRAQKLKSGHAIRRSLLHAFREQDTPNADPTRASENTHIGAKSAEEALNLVNARLPEKVRKNAVLAVEYLITGSAEDMHRKSRKEQDLYFRDALKWLQDKHGKENVIYGGIHRDETTPHLYAYVIPLDERGKLNCRHFFGAANALNLMQTDFFKKVGQFHGLSRGVEGSKAKHTDIREYYDRVNAAFEPLPEVKTPMPNKLRDEPVRPGFFVSKLLKEEFERDFAHWQKQKAAHDAQRKKHLEEVKHQSDAAMRLVRTHQAKASEVQRMRLEMEDLKSHNSFLVSKNKELVGENKKLSDLVKLFRPEEVKAAAVRERQRREREALKAATAQKQEQSIETHNDKFLSAYERDNGP